MPDTTLHCTWSERSASVLTEKEARLAMRLAENDVEKAVSLLKVHASRWCRPRVYQDLYRHSLPSLRGQRTRQASSISRRSGDIEIERTPAAVLVNSDSEPSRNWMRWIRMTSASKSTSSEQAELLRWSCPGEEREGDIDALVEISVRRNDKLRDLVWMRTALRALSRWRCRPVGMAGGRNSWSSAASARAALRICSLVGAVDGNLVAEQLVPRPNAARRQLRHFLSAQEFNRLRLGLGRRPFS